MVPYIDLSAGIAALERGPSSSTLESFVHFMDAYGEWHPRDFRLPLIGVEEDC